MTLDPMLLEECPAAWVPFTVDVEPRQDALILVAQGTVDGWTAGALLRTLVAVYERSFAHVYLDLRHALGADGAIDDVLERCRQFTASHQASLHLSPPPADAAPLGALTA
jgi:hypothetical protein